MKMKKEDKLVSFRRNIIETMKKMSEKWVTSDSIKSKMVFDGLEPKSITLEQIGNNLRVLKNEGVVSDTKIDGRRCWSLTGHKFDDQPVVKMVVAFPKKIHEEMCDKAVSEGLSRTGFIVESVKERIDVGH